MLGFNIIDVFIVSFMVAWALYGYRRGFVITSTDLFSFLGSIYLAAKAYPQLSLYINHTVGTSRGFASLVSFLALFVIFHLVLGLIVIRVYPALYRFVRQRRLIGADRMLGVMPALIGGFVWLSLLLGLLSWFPLSGPIKLSIDQSRIGAPIVEQVAIAEPVIEQIAGQAINDTIAFFAPEHGSGRNRARPNIPAEANDASDPLAEATMLRLINNERGNRGLLPLAPDMRLREVARTHSLDMVKNNYFNHFSPTTGSPSERLERAGVYYLAFGENIAYSQDIMLAHYSLMRSQGHRENILSPAFGKVGIGVINVEPYGYMITQDFIN
ncbi:MAG TPA: CvpA family protein [Candidatus Aquicultor sp.]